ncbi:MAG: hypothetical protein KY445_13810 [Armatimonadetes bacterium]|nr:hypothetical protein [Armatimonadota bacterium]
MKEQLTYISDISPFHALVTVAAFVAVFWLICLFTDDEDDFLPDIEERGSVTPMHGPDACHDEAAFDDSISGYDRAPLLSPLLDYYTPERMREVATRAESN